MERNWLSIPKDTETQVFLGDVIKLGRVRLKIEKFGYRNHIEETIPHLTNVNLKTQTTCNFNPITKLDKNASLSKYTIII